MRDSSSLMFGPALGFSEACPGYPSCGYSSGYSGFYLKHLKNYLDQIHSTHTFGYKRKKF